MDEDWRLLWRLQGLDQKQAKILRDRGLSEGAALRQELQDAANEADRQEKMLAERLTCARSKFKQAELDLRGLEAKLAQVEARLYGGEVVNPKELTQLEHRVEEERAQRAKLEEAYLSLVEEIEGLEAGAESAKARVEKTRRELAEHDREHARLAGEAALSDQDYQTAREKLLLEIPAMHREKYERIHARHPGSALVRIERGNCGGCHTALAQAEIERAARQPAQTTCENCGRLLLPESLCGAAGVDSRTDRPL